MNTSNYEWLMKIAEIKPKSWHSENVLHVSDIENSDYYRRRCNVYKIDIEPKIITGIEYSYGYNDHRKITWIQLLNALKRFDYIRKNFTIKKQLIEHVHKDYGSLKVINKYGDNYLTADGQHRMALAKFLEVPRVKVKIHEYVYDPDSYIEYNYE